METAKRAGDVIVIRIDHPVSSAEIQPLMQSCQMMGLDVRIGVVDGGLGIAMTTSETNNERGNENE